MKNGHDNGINGIGREDLCTHSNLDILNVFQCVKVI